jgi:hypothetical protein
MSEIIEENPIGIIEYTKLEKKLLKTQPKNLITDINIKKLNKQQQKIIKEIYKLLININNKGGRNNKFWLYNTPNNGLTLFLTYNNKTYKLLREHLELLLISGYWEQKTNLEMYNFYGYKEFNWMCGKYNFLKSHHIGISFE